MPQAQFMNLMNDVLADYLDDFVVVFLDDILIYSKTIEDHVVHLRKSYRNSENISYLQRHRSARSPMRASSSLGSR